MIAIDTISKMERLGLCVPYDTVKATSIRSITVDTDTNLPAYKKAYLGINDSYISNRVITSISIHTGDKLSAVNNKDIIDAATLASGVLTLVNTAKDIIAMIPLTDLAVAFHSNKKLQCNFKYIDLSKSYLMFSNGLDQSSRLIINFNLENE